MIFSKDKLRQALVLTGTFIVLNSLIQAIDPMHLIVLLTGS